MKFTLKERNLDEVSPSKMARSQKRAADPRLQQIALQRQLDGEKSSSAGGKYGSGVEAQKAQIQKQNAIAKKAAAQQQTDQVQTQTQQQPVINQDTATQPPVQTDKNQAQMQPQETPAQAGQAQQPPPAPAKPENKAKQAEKVKNKYARLINLPFFKQLTASDSKMAQALMGATSKAQQYAGTPNYIPVLTQGFINAGVPKAEADKAAREAANLDKQATPTQQQPAPKPADKGPAPKPADKGPAPKPADKGPAPKPADKGPAPKPADKGPAANTGGETAVGKPPTPAAGDEQSSQQITQNNAEQELDKIILAAARARVANASAEFGEIGGDDDIETIKNKIGEKNLQGVWSDDNTKLILTKFKTKSGLFMGIDIPNNSREPIMGSTVVSTDTLSQKGFKQQDAESETSQVQTESLIFRKSTRGIFVLKG
jgi:hypothetical protein